MYARRSHVELFFQELQSITQERLCHREFFVLGQKGRDQNQAVKQPDGSRVGKKKVYFSCHVSCKQRLSDESGTPSPNHEALHLLEFQAVVSNPTFSEDEAREVLRDLFGASGSSEFKSLPSFDDQNFRVTTSTGRFSLVWVF